ncbi:MULTISPECIES: cyanoexosortase A [Nostocales]|uniref:Exosortase n=3 Tax=Nostocales TaxID=1161 RepID=A0A0C1N5D9_9CYAN|nr:cyanoexosortase A [Tolypothrix bouteillei]KAF3888796.1 cyanoexosortase A [Tolypothrix bouteillei VB521301]
MKTIPLTSVQQLKYPQLWLLGIGACLIIIHLTVTWKADNSNLLSSCILYWISISSLIWDKHHTLNLESGIFSSFFSLVLICLVLLKSATLTSFGLFLYFTPLIIAFSLALLASGFKGLKQYKGELIALFFLGAFKIVPSSLIGTLSSLTAKFAAFMLWYTGSQVALSGVIIYLPTGSVEVLSGCSGIEQIFQMLGLSLLFLLMFPQNGKQKIITPIVAASLGFIVNGIRVVLMAILVAKNQQEAFKYWHEGDGSLVFYMIAVVLFGLFCWFLIGRGESKTQNATGVKQ